MPFFFFFFAISSLRSTFFTLRTFIFPQRWSRLDLGNNRFSRTYTIITSGDRARIVCSPLAVDPHTHAHTRPLNIRKNCVLTRRSPMCTRPKHVAEPAGRNVNGRCCCAHVLSLTRVAYTNRHGFLTRVPKRTFDGGGRTRYPIRRDTCRSGGQMRIAGRSSTRCTTDRSH